MLQYVNSVLVGKAQATTVGSLSNAGDLVMVDEKGAIISTEAAAAAAKKIRLGLVSDKTLDYANPATGDNVSINLVQYSNYLTPDSIVSYKTFSYSAPIEDVITINMDNATIVAGHRYVLRLVYRDIYEHPAQFAHTYEYIAKDNDNAIDVANEFKSLINKDTRRRCTATVGAKASATVGGMLFSAVNTGATGNSITIELAAATTASSISVTNNAIVITPKTGELALANIQALIASSTTAAALISAISGTLSGEAVSATSLAGGNSNLVITALKKDDNEGKESINVYTRVNVVAGLWYTNPSATGFASKNKYPLSGVTISKTSGFNGAGYWKEIRDREQAALSYRGILNRTWWPVIKPELNVIVDGEYDGCIIEFQPEHANAEDSFSKTKQSIEVYAINDVALASTMIGKQIAAFFNRATA